MESGGSRKKRREEDVSLSMEGKGGDSHMLWALKKIPRSFHGIRQSESGVQLCHCTLSGYAPVCHDKAAENYSYTRHITCVSG